MSPLASDLTCKHHQTPKSARFASLCCFPPLFAVVSVVCACVCTFICAAAPCHATQSEPPHTPVLELSVLGGANARRATSNQSSNPSPITYTPSAQLALELRAYVTRWLNATLYHHRSYPRVDLPRGAAKLDYTHIEKNRLQTYSIGIHLEPTYHFTQRLRGWLSVGAGWGRMNWDSVFVTEPLRTYRIDARSGVFVEIPIGLGASYELIPKWLAVQGQLRVAPLVKQSGDLFDTVQIVDNFGQIDTTGPMPTQTVSASALLGLSLLL